MDRIEKSGKINSEEKTRFKEQFETKEGSPNGGNAVESIRKELKRLKVADNREEILKGKKHTLHTAVHTLYRMGIIEVVMTGGKGTWIEMVITDLNLPLGL